MLGADWSSEYDYILNASKIRLDFVYAISIIVVEAIVYLVTSCVWNFMYLYSFSKKYTIDKGT